MMRSLACCLSLVMIVSSLTGCALTRHGMESPRINISNVTPREVTFFEQVFDLELRIQNPNDSPLEISGLAFDLELNDRRFATGVSNQNLFVDRLSSGVIHVEALTTLWGFIQQVAEYQRTKAPRVAYRLKGNLFVSSPSFKLPFDDNGEVQIPVEPTKQ